MEDENANISEEAQVTLKDHSIKYGVILGLIGIIITVLVYIVSPAALASPWMGLLLLFYFAYLIYVGINYRNQIGGFIDWTQAFMHAFIVLVVAGLIGTVFNILLYSVIDTSLPQTLADASGETALSMAERFGAPEEAAAEAAEQAVIDTKDRLTTVGLIKSFGWGLIAYAVISSISGLIVRKRLPEDDVV